MGVPMRLNLVTLEDEVLDEPRECIRDLALDEERSLNAELVEEGENTVDVANHALRNRRVVVDTRLVPVLDVDRERSHRLRIPTPERDRARPAFARDLSVGSAARGCSGHFTCDDDAATGERIVAESRTELSSQLSSWCESEGPQTATIRIFCAVTSTRRWTRCSARNAVRASFPRDHGSRSAPPPPAVMCTT